VHQVSYQALGLEADDSYWVSGVIRRAEREGLLPECIADDTSCPECDLAFIDNCPVQMDQETRSYLQAVSEVSRTMLTLRSERIEILVSLLRKYKRPMHWENVAVFAIRESASLFPSRNIIKQLLFANPDRFSNTGNGVFRPSG